jgi:GTP-binding protein HflX
VPVVAIVGYTNAGKSTLLNTLTHANELAEDKLFATLDPRSRRLRFPEDREVVLTDTVGLIRDMPEDLFAAFRATFEEAADADLILQVIDASDRDRDQHIQTTEKMLSEIGCEAVPRILVFNKADLLDPGDGHRLTLGTDHTVVLSALRRETTRALLSMMGDMLADKWSESALSPPLLIAPVEEDDGGEDVLEASLNTLDAMLEATGRRVKRINAA